MASYMFIKSVEDVLHVKWKGAILYIRINGTYIYGHSPKNISAQ